MKPTSTQEEQKIQQQITRIVADQKHSLPVLPPEDWKKGRKGRYK
jgi:hypothetical protein